MNLVLEFLYFLLVHFMRQGSKRFKVRDKVCPKGADGKYHVAKVQFVLGAILSKP